MAIGDASSEALVGAEVIDCAGGLVLPGFVQAHVHMAQTLFRGLGEGLELLEWLSQRILPLEAAHDADTLYASARLGLAELILGGHTALLDFGSVVHMEAIFEAARDMGIRLTSGKIMMDQGKATPAPLKEDSRRALAGAEKILGIYHGKENGRLRVALTPRFLLSCSPKLLEASLKLAAEADVLWHTHIAEQIPEIRAVMKDTGKRSLELLEDLGAGEARLALAHMVHLTAKEKRILSGWRAGVLHCPRANSKLGSGVAKIPEFIESGVTVGLGSDGSACNNRLDMFEEMRAAAALQDLNAAPGALSGGRLLQMATSGGARAIGIDDVAGTLDVGKRADLIVLDTNRVASVSGAEPCDAVAHHLDARAVKLVMVDGVILAADGKLRVADEAEIVREAARAIETLKQRAFS